jgi:rubrerythrin
MTGSTEKSCANCGQALAADFSGILCPGCGQTYWKCGSCGFLLTAATPPNECPGCKKKCEFKNVTCYTPECGGPGNIDPRL